jgi:hypothetical protein
MTDYSFILRKMAAEGQGYFSEGDRLHLLSAADRIAELEKENGRLRDLAYIAYQDGYKDAPPYSKYERSLDEIGHMWKRSFACAALKGEKE